MGLVGRANGFATVSPYFKEPPPPRSPHLTTDDALLVQWDLESVEKTRLIPHSPGKEGVEEGVMTGGVMPVAGLPLANISLHLIVIPCRPWCP